MATELAQPQQGSGLSPRTVAVVQESWGAVLPIADAAATLFYDRLFTLDPALRAMFKPDMSEQKKKLMQTLSIAVDGLGSPEKLVPVLEQLGIRHAGYMVTEHHYDLVGEALLWTLEEGLGDGYTREVEGAWKEVYGLVAGTMKKAAAQANAQAAASMRAVRSERRRDAASESVSGVLPISESAATLQHDAPLARLLEDPGQTLATAQHFTSRPPAPSVRFPSSPGGRASSAPPTETTSMAVRRQARAEPPAEPHEVTVRVRVVVDAERAHAAASVGIEATPATAAPGAPVARAESAPAALEPMPILLLALLGPLLSAGPVTLALVMMSRPEGGGGMAVAAALIGSMLMSVAFASGYLMGRGRAAPPAAPAPARPAQLNASASPRPTPVAETARAAQATPAPSTIEEPQTERTEPASSEPPAEGTA